MKLIRQLLGLFSVILLGSVAMVALRTAYRAALPERPPYTQQQQKLVTTLSKDVGNWLDETLPAGQTRAVFGNLDHDDFGFVSEPVRNAIWSTGRFELAPRSFWERLRQRTGWTLPHWAPGPALRNYAAARQADVAIDGSVLELTAVPSATLRVHLEIRRPVTGEILAARDFSARPANPLGALDRPLGRAVPAQVGLLAWIALILLLPLAILPFARDLLLYSSNGLILLVLLVLVALDVGSAYLLYAGRVEGWLGSVLTLVIFGLCFGLNAKYLTWMKEQQA